MEFSVEKHKRRYYLPKGVCQLASQVYLSLSLSLLFSSLLFIHTQFNLSSSSTNHLQLFKQLKLFIMAVQMTDKTEIISNYTNWTIYPAHNASGEVIAEAVLHQLTTRNILRDGMKVLEIGCGYGNFLWRLASKFPNVHAIGIDLTPHMVSGARHYLKVLKDLHGFPNDKNLKRVQAIVGDATQLREGPLKEELGKLTNTSSPAYAKFDLIISVATLQHMDRNTTSNLLETLRLYLQPEGRIFAEVRCPDIHASTVMSHTIQRPGVGGISPYRGPIIPYDIGEVRGNVCWIHWPVLVTLCPPGTFVLVKASIAKQLAQQVPNLQVLNMLDHEQLFEGSGNEYLLHKGTDNSFLAVQVLLPEAFAKLPPGLNNHAKWEALLDPNRQDNKDLLESRMRGHIVNNRRVFDTSINNFSKTSDFAPITAWWHGPGMFVLLKKF
jgi:SAM-dependent methyltransferase